MSDDAEGYASAFIFEGSWREYAPIALTNLLLIAVTLGIYRFWAKTRERRYLWSRTRFIGDALEWTGTGKELLVGFLLAILLFGPPILILQFGVQALAIRGFPVAAAVTSLVAYFVLLYVVGVARFRALRYRLSRTYWHGIRGGSAARGWRYGLSALWKPIAGSAALGLLTPWSMMSLWNERWRAMSFGSLPFTTDGRSRPLMGRFLILYLSPLLLLLMFIAAVGTFGGRLGNAYFFLPFPPAVKIPLFIIVVLMGTFLFGIMVLYYYAGFVAQAIGGMRLGELELQFDADSDEWFNLFLGDFLLVVGTLGIGVAFLNYRHWRFLITHLEAGGAIDLSQLTQSSLSSPSQGEGLLDAFDVGAF